MKNTLALIILTLSKIACADDWLCSEESSERRGNAILACGIGQSEDEAQARALALQAAKSEFKTLCDDSEDCAQHAVIITPKRTACKEGKCYRLVSFEIQATRTQIAHNMAYEKKQPKPYQDPFYSKMDQLEQMSFDAIPHN